MRHALPRILGGRSEQLENLVQLIEGITNARKGWHSGNHLDKDTADAPHVERRRIFGAAEENICGRERNMSQCQQGAKLKAHLVGGTKASRPHVNTCG